MKMKSKYKLLAFGVAGMLSLAMLGGADTYAATTVTTMDDLVRCFRIEASEQTCVLGADIDNAGGTITVPSFVVGTIDLNGYSLGDSDDILTITNNGSLTLTGKGNYNASLNIEGTGDLTIENGTFHNAVQISSMKYICDEGRVIDMTEIDDTQINSICWDVFGSLNITGGEFDNNIVILVGGLTISGGKFSTPPTIAVIREYQIVNISGGEFEPLSDEGTERNRTIVEFQTDPLVYAVTEDMIKSYFANGDVLNNANIYVGNMEDELADDYGVFLVRKNIDNAAASEEVKAPNTGVGGEASLREVPIYIMATTIIVSGVVVGIGWRRVNKKKIDFDK